MFYQVLCVFIQMQFSAFNRCCPETTTKYSPKEGISSHILWMPLQSSLNHTGPFLNQRAGTSDTEGAYDIRPPSCPPHTRKRSYYKAWFLLQMITLKIFLKQICCRKYLFFRISNDLLLRKICIFKILCS